MTFVYEMSKLRRSKFAVEGRKGIVRGRVSDIAGNRIIEDRGWSNVGHLEFPDQFCLNGAHGGRREDVIYPDPDSWEEQQDQPPDPYAGGYHH